MHQYTKMVELTPFLLKPDHQSDKEYKVFLGKLDGISSGEALRLADCLISILCSYLFLACTFKV